MELGTTPAGAFLIPPLPCGCTTAECRGALRAAGGEADGLSTDGPPPRLALLGR
jgi:hypothetical protein